MVIRAIWEFDVDDTDMDEEFVIVKGMCADLAERELNYLLQHNELSAEDFIYEVHPEIPSVYKKGDD